jgi:two-component system chemotaxis response regulator CheB
VIAVASSTGGPSALMEIFTRFPVSYRNAVLIAQHMPDKFTRTFAERLSRRGTLRVNEAQDQDVVGEGAAFVCPGRHCMELEVSQQRGTMKLKVMQPSERDRYVPSADRLLSSVAAGMGRRAVGVILTGMGDDGVEGAGRILEAGGIVIAESEESAVVYGMPGAAVRAGVATRSLPLSEIAELLAKL